MELVQIAALGKRNELGKNNALIWHLKEDMKFFRRMTKGHTIVMGRKTFESLPGMLPKRHHIIITRDLSYSKEGIEIFHSIEDFIEAYKEKKEEVFVIGGGQIYSQLLPYSSHLYLTEIDHEFDADVFYPEFNREDYYCNVLTDFEEDGIHYRHIEYIKK